MRINLISTRKRLANVYQLLLVWSLLIASSPVFATDYTETATPSSTKHFTIVTDSPYNFDETVKRVQEAILSNDFRVFPERYVEQGLTDEFSVNEQQIVIRFCHFGKLYKALQIEPRLGVVLPCKITVLENKQGKVQLAYIDAVELAKMFDNKELSKAAVDIQESYNDIIDEMML